MEYKGGGIMQAEIPTKYSVKNDEMSRKVGVKEKFSDKRDESV